MAMKAWLAGLDEFAKLYGVVRSGAANWRRRGLLTDEQAIIVSGSPVWPLGFAVEFGETTPYRKRLVGEALEQVKAAQGQGRLVTAAADVDPLCGNAEITALFGWARNYVNVVRNRDDTFPAPDYEVSGAPIWLVGSIENWARSKDRVMDAAVLKALKDKTYDGPGSKVLVRGAAANAPAE
ncbi:hypothetical protein [Embleya sp. NPDC059237]|uniref:hypothetical protein n=1 Tax=Embleya sp. NPDC059237 TaxID=3346784 RepID=UPI0036752F27